MTWSLDTNIVIHLIDGEHSTIDSLEGLRGDFAISAVTRVELEGGVYRIRTIHRHAAANGYSASND